MATPHRDSSDLLIVAVGIRVYRINGILSSVEGVVVAEGVAAIRIVRPFAAAVVVACAAMVPVDPVMAGPIEDFYRGKC